MKNLNFSINITLPASVLAAMEVNEDTMFETYFDGEKLVINLVDEEEYFSDDDDDDYCAGCDEFYPGHDGECVFLCKRCGECMRR